MRRVIALLAGALLFATGAGAQDLQTRIFQLANRPAEATVGMVAPLLSPAGTVMAETRLQKLVVRDTAEKLEEVARLLAEIDQPSPQVRIFVSMDGVSPSSGHQVGASIYGDPRNPMVSATGYAHSGNSAVQSEQNLLVMSGERGVIMMARDLLTIDPYYQFATGQGLLAPGFVVQNVSTGFAVQPVVVGDVVRLTITPWLSFVGPSGRAEVMVDQASTTVALKSGQETTIASGATSQHYSGSAYGLIFGSTGSSLERGASVRVRPEIFDDPSAPGGTP